MDTKIVFNHPDYSDELIYKSIVSILSQSHLLSMSSIKNSHRNPTSWINTAYFAFSPKLDIYFLTPETTQHSENIVVNDSVALAIYDSTQSGDKNRGLQIFGTCKQAAGNTLREGYHTYSERFPWLNKVIKQVEDFKENIIQSKLYVIHPSEIKIFDEVIFGEENWVTVYL